jgi:hypothetical protein
MLGVIEELQPTIPHVIVAGVALKEAHEAARSGPLFQEPEQFFVGIVRKMLSQQTPDTPRTHKRDQLRDGQVRARGVGSLQLRH